MLTHMKCLPVFALLTFVVSGLAQTPAPQPQLIRPQEPAPQPRVIRPTLQSNGTESEALKSNYVVTLAWTEKDKPQEALSFLTAYKRFEASSADAYLAFKGSVAEMEDGSLFIAYVLNIRVPVPVDTVKMESTDPAMGIRMAMDLMPEMATETEPIVTATTVVRS